MMRFKTAKELDFTEGTVELVSTKRYQQHLGSSAIVLVPQPTNNVDDPLRWPQHKKHLALFSTLSLTFLTNFTFSGPSSGFQNIALYFDISIQQTSGLLSWLVLALGLSNFFWIPTAVYFGKRPVFLVACAMVFVCAIWGAASKSFGSLLASTVVGGFGGGASEAVGAAIVNDLYFLHERGRMMGIYMLAISWGSSIGPLIGGFLIERVGWQWQKWLSAILVGLNLICIFFFLPETRWDRSNKRIESSRKCSTSAEAASTKESFALEEIPTVVNDNGLASESASLEASDETWGVRKTFIQELNPWSGVDRNVSFLNLFLRPLPLIVYPACTFAVLAYSIALAPAIMVNIVSSPILESPPYLFGSGIVGLTNVAGMIGQLIGFLLGGPVTDTYAKYRASKNNGIFYPESRLPLLILPAVIVIGGQILFGFAAQHTFHWVAIYIAYGMISVGLTAIVSIAMTYAVESYYVVSQECLELVNGLKNAVTFGFVYAAVPWLGNQGYAKTFVELSGVFCAIMLLAVPLFIWGPRIRHVTATKWRLISVDTSST